MTDFEPPGVRKRTAAGADDRRAHARAIELFQLVFMQVAAAQLRPEDFAVKGGGNLRFFLRSGRRSADLDLDYVGTDFDRFGDRVDSLLRGQPVVRLLRLQELTLSGVTLHKSSATTKRWKFKLSRPGMQEASSKVEFSNRRSALRPVLEETDRELVRELRGTPVRVLHYPPEAAIIQKVGALRGRSSTEPRDVFDLDHLIRLYPPALGSADLEATELREAAAIAERIPYAHYEELVEPYLDETVVDLYSGEEAWLGMQLRVAESLRQKAGPS